LIDEWSVPTMGRVVMSAAAEDPQEWPDERIQRLANLRREVKEADDDRAQIGMPTEPFPGVVNLRRVPRTPRHGALPSG
jgi:hypothetical protein